MKDFSQRIFNLSTLPKNKREKKTYHITCYTKSLKM